MYCRVQGRFLYLLGAFFFLSGKKGFKTQMLLGAYSAILVIMTMMG